MARSGWVAWPIGFIMGADLVCWLGHRLVRVAMESVWSNATDPRPPFPWRSLYKQAVSYGCAFAVGLALLFTLGQPLRAALVFVLMWNLDADGFFVFSISENRLIRGMYVTWAIILGEALANLCLPFPLTLLPVTIQHWLAGSVVALVVYANRTDWWESILALYVFLPDLVSRTVVLAATIVVSFVAAVVQLVLFSRAARRGAVIMARTETGQVTRIPMY